MSITTETSPGVFRTLPRVGKKPKVGDKVDTRVGLAVVLAVRQNGLRLEVATERHGDEFIERAERGHWMIYERIR